VLAFKPDEAGSQQRSFTLTLVECIENVKLKGGLYFKSRTYKDLGSKYTFMVDQLQDARLASKEVHIYPGELSKLKPEVMLYQRSVLSFGSIASY
jgi:hypothetical protein